jgi:hypothetical protein
VIRVVDDQAFRAMLLEGTPPGWSVRAVTLAGRDVTDLPIEIAGHLSNVVISFTDRPTEVRGRVSVADGTDSTASVVAFPGPDFPLNALSWDTGSGRFRLVRVDTRGNYVLYGLPAGNYLVAAVPDEATVNWTDPEFLSELSRFAAPIQITHGERRTLDLQMTPVQR